MKHVIQNNNSYFESNPTTTCLNKFISEKKTIETESEKCFQLLKDLNPSFCPFVSVTSEYMLEFRTILWDNLMGLLKIKYSEMIVKKDVMK